MRRLIAIALFACFGCGDIGNVQVSLSFSDAALASATRRLAFITREAPVSGDGCAALWSTASNTLAESSALVDYPNRNDIVTANVSLTRYPALTVLVYAHPSRSVDIASPQTGAIAGGCKDVRSKGEETTEIAVELSPPPRR